MSYSVAPITSEEYKPMLLQGHYAGTVPSVSYAYGLFLDTSIVGCVTYGTPPSPPLRVGVCGEEYANIVLELNRLFLLDNKPNEGSMLVGRSLALLPEPSIVISFADKKMGHVGYVYQATNFIYTGLSAKRTDWKIKGLENLHSMSIADISRGKKNRAEYMREKFGEDFYLKARSRKHRYIYFVGNKRTKKKLREALQYPVMEYPKENVRHYETDNISIQERLL